MNWLVDKPISTKMTPQKAPTPIITKQNNKKNQMHKELEKIRK